MYVRYLWKDSAPSCPKQKDMLTFVREWLDVSASMNTCRCSQSTAVVAGPLPATTNFALSKAKNALDTGLRQISQHLHDSGVSFSLPNTPNTPNWPALPTALENKFQM